MFLDFELEQNRIAERPSRKRSAAKLLVATKDGVFTDSSFSELSSFLNAGDLLVFNRTKVRNCRLFSKRQSDQREFELLFVSEHKDRAANGAVVYEALVKSLKKLKVGDRLEIDSHSDSESEPVKALQLEYLERSASGDTALFFLKTFDGSDAGEKLEELGLPPIPPYIRDGRSDRQDCEDYQTVFASEQDCLDGSVAAPTAGLHFDQELLKALEQRGVELDFLTLELGRNSISPISAEAAKGGELPEELFLIPESLKLKIEKLVCKLADTNNSDSVSKPKLVAVGTTTVRALESAALAGDIEGCASKSGFTLSSHPGGFRGTRLCISPGFNFQLVDSLVTNFHLPNSSHLMLVNAFSGSELTEKLYSHALKQDYSFFSYGDGMFIE